MTFKRLVLVVAILSVAFVPFIATGCGSDDTTKDKAIGVYTVGPGNLTADDMKKIPVVSTK